MRAAEPDSPTFLHRVAAVATLLLSAAAAMFAYGSLQANLVWLPAWIALSALYTVAGVGVWRAEPWAPSLTLGVVLWGGLAWTQSMFGLGVNPLTVTAAGGHWAAVALLAVTPSMLERRHRVSLAMAGAALPGAVLFGLAPMQTLTVSAVLMVGTALLFAMAMGIARGRTWGLLAAGLAVPMIVAGVVLAPATVGMEGPHPMLPAWVQFRGVLLLRFVGVVAASLAFASVLPFFGPIVRFVRGR